MSTLAASVSFFLWSSWEEVQSLNSARISVQVPHPNANKFTIFGFGADVILDIQLALNRFFVLLAGGAQNFMNEEAQN